MRRKGTGRGSRFEQRGVFSASTIATIPSGCTMATGGFSDPTTVGSLMSAATKGMSITHGLADGTNNPGGATNVVVTHGHTTLYAFTAVVLDSMATSSGVSGLVIGSQTGTTKTVWAFGPTGAGVTIANGSSIAWTAFGI